MPCSWRWRKANGFAGGCVCEIHVPRCYSGRPERCRGTGSRGSAGLRVFWCLCVVFIVTCRAVARSAKAGVVAAAVVLSSAGGALAQPAEGTASFRVFLKGSAIGGEEVTVRRTPAGITITSNGRLAAPLDLVTRQCVLRYDANWHPIDLTVDAVARGAALVIRTTFADGKATSEITQAGAPTTKTDTVAPDTLVLPNLFFSAYEALAMRLASIPDGASFPGLRRPPGRDHRQAERALDAEDRDGRVESSTSAPTR